MHRCAPHFPRNCVRIASCLLRERKRWNIQDRRTELDITLISNVNSKFDSLTVSQEIAIQTRYYVYKLIYIYIYIYIYILLMHML